MIEEQHKVEIARVQSEYQGTPDQRNYCDSLRTRIKAMTAQLSPRELQQTELKKVKDEVRGVVGEIAEMWNDTNAW
jgi:hypothetical protein